MNCTQQTEVKNTVESTAKNWSRFGLRSELLRTLDRRGFTEPTPVQAEVLNLLTRLRRERQQAFVLGLRAFG